MSIEQLEMTYVEQCASDPVTLMEELCAAIDRFNDHWPHCVVDIEAFRISLYEDGLVPESVVPESIVGEEAIVLCAQALRAFSRPKQQHPGSVYRVPGYILLDRLLLEEIDRINQLKLELKQSIQRLYPNARARNSFYRNTFPGRVMLQVFRLIRTARSPVEALRFSWSPTTHAVTHLTRAEALALLNNRLKLGVDVKSHQRALYKAIEEVTALGKTARIIRERPRAPYPVATLVHSSGRKGIRKMIPLSLPLFVGPGIDGKAVDIGTLAPYDMNIRRRSRSDRVKSTLLFSPLYLRYR